ncbi:MAG: hypothetical protein WB760_15765 [Xanthobacteraceae bacterium]
MSESDRPPPEFKELPAPTQCALWRQPDLALSPRERFEVVETFADESHLSRSLLRCSECGQLYFYEFYENVDWAGGDDAQYQTYIPVSARDEAVRMKDLSVFDLMLYSPRLQRDHRTGKPGVRVCWIGKDE